MDSQARFEERMKELRDGFVAGLPERLAIMRAALRADDRATVQHEAHRLAGTGVSYGLPQLSSWGRDVERKLKSGAALASVAEALDELSTIIASLEPGEWSV
ncbi:MAG: Hpt domain-containing protein [Myxococcales bacterium]|nr:Hpt domain-containing protein [Myxococcales bacterium]